ncbi:MAG: hypothetical protein A2156_05180 [Deltaproteobacteria bacterium RBG_16_48_10]|nr:MAG: hypothetical protein A2156_05180 [Deltaproteobacteria bacterium RBG_16_48_10]
MPKGESTAPSWRSGPGTGRRGMGGRRGRMGGTKPGSGPVGECVCPSCGTTAPHEVKSDKIKANDKDGVLKITLPKSEEAKKKEVKIKVE